MSNYSCTFRKDPEIPGFIWDICVGRKLLLPNHERDLRGKWERERQTGRERERERNLEFLFPPSSAASTQTLFAKSGIDLHGTHNKAFSLHVYKIYFNKTKKKQQIKHVSQIPGVNYWLFLKLYQSLRKRKFANLNSRLNSICF